MLIRKARLLVSCCQILFVVRLKMLILYREMFITFRLNVIFLLMMVMSYSCILMLVRKIPFQPGFGDLMAYLIKQGNLF